MAIVDAREISKTYPATGGVRALLGRGGIGSWLRSTPAPRPALAPMSLEIAAGEAVGIIGRNGSGKSTLLKLIAGVTAPTGGSLAVHGRVASLLELGAGFHPMLTGRENVYLNAGLLGMRHAAVDACFDAIVAFSGIGEFIDQTVDTYSSGMYVRLAFSVAIHSDPDVFLVDEVLSVGDESYQRKCRARIMELKAAGKTILFVSHDLGTVQALCDRVILLDQGQVLSRGNAQDTIDFYLRQIGQESGIHRLVSGDTEVLFNHGRLSLFYRQREVTAPLGVKAQLLCMGSYHESTAATWTITRSDPDWLEAEGPLPRLPVTIHLSARLKGEIVRIIVTWENHQPLRLEYVALQCFFPTTYTRWYYAGDAGSFPVIDVTDRQWGNVVPARHNAGPTYLLPPEDSPLPVVCIDVEPEHTAVPLQLDITDYLTQACLAHVTEAIPPAACPLPPARRPLAALRLDPSRNAEDVSNALNRAQANRALDSAGCTGRMERGAIIVTRDKAHLTEGLHLHLRLKTAGLWTLSQGLQWEPPVREGDGLTATARTPRLPGRVHWMLEPREDGMGVEMVLEASAPIQIDEYNVSLELAAVYDGWETPGESGTFAPVDGPRDWHHLNRSFAPGDWVRGRAASLPAITIQADAMLAPPHPAALQIGGNPGGSVIQILCSPELRAAFELAPGRHVLFRGRITTAPLETP